jgi:hypothetical protein
MDAKKKAKLIRTLTDTLYELLTIEPVAAEKPPKSIVARTANKAHGKVLVTKADPRTKVKIVRGKRGPKKGGKAQPKPCPVTGTLNTYRRFSYLMPEVRTPENLAKFKGASKAQPAKAA